MPRVTKLLNNFNTGEISPELDARVDQQKYSSASKTIDNFIIRPEGGIHRRSGTRFIKEVTDSTKRSRLVPFEFSEAQAYMLEFSHGKFRVYADEVQVDLPEQSTLTGTEASITTDEFEMKDHGFIDRQGPIHITATGGIPGGGYAEDTDYYVVLPKTITFDDDDIGSNVITHAGHEYSDEMGPFRMTTTGGHPAGLQGNTDYYIVRLGSSTFSLSTTAGGPAITITTEYGGTHTLAPTGDYKRDKFRMATTPTGAPIDINTSTGTSPHTFTPNPGGTPSGLPLEVISPYGETDIPSMRFVQSADILFIDGGGQRPVQISRLSNTKWSVDYQNIIDGPYLAENTVEASTMTMSATTGFHITVTLSSPTEVNGGDGWGASDIGRLVRAKVLAAGQWGYMEITGFRTSLIATATVRSVITAGAEHRWRLGSWYSGNWPKSISFADQRLWHAGEPNTPQTLHGSNTGVYLDFSPTDITTLSTVLDTSAVNFEVGANQVNATRWIAVNQQLFRGTASSVFTAIASNDGEVITPTNVNLPQVTAVGAADVQAVNIAESLLYVTRNHQSLRAIVFSSEGQGYRPEDVNRLARHIFGRINTIKEMSFQHDRHEVLWIVRSDGVLVACTFTPDQSIFAWHRHTIGGSFGSGDAFVESVATIPSTDGTHDQVWLIVKRTVNGATVRHIELMEDDWIDDEATSMRFLDSAPAAYSGVATATFSGLDHLIGETVSVLAGGAVHPDRVVNGSGVITLNGNYTDVVAGLPYTSLMETLKLEPPDLEGAAMGKVARIDHVIFRFYNSLGGEIGPDVNNLDPIVFRDASDPMDESVPVFSGDKKVSIDGGFQREKVLVIRQTQPLPFNVLSMNVMMSTGQR